MSNSATRTTWTQHLHRRVLPILAIAHLTAAIGPGGPPERNADGPVPSASPGNRLSYMDAGGESLISANVPEQVATRWLAEFRIGDVVLVDLSRVGRRPDLTERAVRDYNLRGDANWAIRFLPRGTDAAIVDVNGDGAVDLVTTSDGRAETLVWSPEERDWLRTSFPVASGAGGVRWGVIEPGGPVTVLVRSIGITGAWQYRDGQWKQAHHLTHGLEIDGRRLLTGSIGRDRGVRLVDLDGDGRCELLAGGEALRGVLTWNDASNRWVAAPFALPDEVAITDQQGGDAGLRFVDLDRDGDQDIIFSNESRYSVHLFESMQAGWVTPLLTSRRAAGDGNGFPPIAYQGRATGAWYDAETQTVHPSRTAAATAKPASLQDELVMAELRRVQPAAVEGFATLIQNDGDSDEWYNYEGRVVPNHHLRQANRDAKIVWETPPVQTDIANGRVTFVFLGAVGYRSQPATDGYALEINGHEMLRFDVTERLAQWKSDNGDASLLFRPTWTSSEDAAGFFYLSLSPKLVTPNHGVRVGVRSLGSGSRRRFALHPVADVVPRQPARSGGTPATPHGGDDEPTTYQVGAAAIDVTPAEPIRLRGYAGRDSESEGVTQQLWAKALVVQSPERPPALLITLDNCLIPAYLRAELALRLQRRVGLHPDRLAITATHTHNGPILARMSETLYCHPLPEEHRQRIERYTASLIDKLEQVAVEAFQDRQAARLSWAIGQVRFARNRRTKGGPVDHDLPVLVAKDKAGNVRAIYLSYACHCTTLSHNRISGDWAGYAQEMIERSHRGAVALVSIGCGADANPTRDAGAADRIAARHGEAISTEVDRLLRHDLRPVSGELETRFARVDLQLDKLPSRGEWESRASREDADRGGTIGYHARVHLRRLDRGEPIKTRVPLPVQTWAFGENLAVVFLGGEVVVDYALRLKQEFDRRRIWINAYANEVPCYIPSERVLLEGGYEGGGAMIFHDWAAPFSRGLENKIVEEVRYQLGKAFHPAISH